MSLELFYDRVGGSLEDTLRRLPGEGFVKKFLLRYLDDPSFSQLEDAVARSDWESAFRAAHTVKGVAQNLGLGDLYRSADVLTEALRGGREPTDRALLCAVETAQAEVLAGIREI